MFTSITNISSQKNSAEKKKFKFDKSKFWICQFLIKFFVKFKKKLKIHVHNIN
jgi:hypothetical protein